MNKSNIGYVMLSTLMLTSALILSDQCRMYDGASTDRVNQANCASIRYVPENPSFSVANVKIDSVEGYSPKRLNRGWITLDHIGYKDSAFQGERHIATMYNGVQFFGYDQEPLSDIMLLKHPTGENQTINTVQSPVRADWHTLNGNGVLFGCTISGGKPNTDYGVADGDQSEITISGYSVVATASEIQVRQFSGSTIKTMGQEGTYQVLYSQPKICPGQNFTIEITNGHAKIFLDTKKIYEMDLNTEDRGTGLVTTYMEHCCPSLSSIFMYNHTVNGIDYLKENTSTKNKGGD